MYVVVSTVEVGITKVQAVPTSFFKHEANKTTYFYPKKSKNVKKAIQKQLIPNDKDWYEIVNYKIISSEIGKELIYLYWYIMVSLKKYFL